MLPTVTASDANSSSHPIGFRGSRRATTVPTTANTIAKTMYVAVEVESANDV